MAITPFIDRLEPRQLLTFATLDSSFGKGGVSSHDFFLSPESIFSSLTPLADGRIIMADQGSIHFLHGDGAVDTSRRAGAIEFKASALDVSVDPITGRFAVLRRTRETGQGNYGLSIDVYDPKGHTLATRVLDNDFGGANNDAGPYNDGFGAGVLIASDGSVLVAVPLESLSGTPSDATIEIRRYSAALAPDLSYGTNGVGSVVAYPGFVINTNEFTISDLNLDAAGDAYVNFRTTTVNANPSRGTIESKVVRFTPSGAVDSTYGNAGIATIYSYQNTHNYNDDPAPTQRTTIEVAGLALRVTPSGRVYMATRETILPGDGSQAIYRQYGLIRVDADGQTCSTIDVGPEVTTTDVSTVGLAIDGSSGAIYVATNAQGPTASIYKYFDDGQSLTVDPTWSHFGDAAVTSGHEQVMAAAVDRSGRLLVDTDFAHAQLIAIAGTSETPASLATNSVKRLADGSIYVNGTTKADHIDVGTKSGRLRVTLNGKTTDFGKVIFNGLVIRAGNGNDVITFGTAITSGYVDAGAGNDQVTCSGKFGGVTLLGGSGNDRLSGAGGGDYLYGQAGNDTLLGMNGADQLLGGDGADQLFASIAPTSSSATTYDGVADRLDGGAGADLIHVDRDILIEHDVDETSEISTTLEAVDLVLNADSADTIAGQ